MSDRRVSRYGNHDAHCVIGLGCDFLVEAIDISGARLFCRELQFNQVSSSRNSQRPVYLSPAVRLRHSVGLASSCVSCCNSNLTSCGRSSRITTGRFLSSEPGITHILFRRIGVLEHRIECLTLAIADSAVIRPPCPRSGLCGLLQ
jgi:hypothetical protein